ncbi:hypothetical protein ACWEDF_13275 [Micromonospora chersina]
MTPPRRPDGATVARILAEYVAATKTGKIHLTRSRLARDLTARTGYPYTPGDIALAVSLAAPVLAGTWGVYATRTVEPGRSEKGYRWRFSVQPPEAA